MTLLSPPPLRFAPLQIAIDGPAGAGKSTAARQVARVLGLIYVDTGAMYRALAWAVVARNISPDNSEAVCRLAQSLRIRLEQDADGVRVFADDQDISSAIRTPKISALASPLSALPCVRTHMVALQQTLAAGQGVVMEGRDIGTVVLPNAPVKVFLTASTPARARRRLDELAERGVAYSLSDLEREIAERDLRDATRDTAPMRPAADAVLVSSDGLSVDQVVARILEITQGAQTS